MRVHAGASEVTVTVLERDGGCAVRIADDGCGFDPALAAPESPSEGFAAMRARAELGCGSLHVESAPGRGTTRRGLAAAPAPASDAGMSASPIRVLIAEEDDVARDELATLVRSRAVAGARRCRLGRRRGNPRLDAREARGRGARRAHSRWRGERRAWHQALLAADAHPGAVGSGRPRDGARDARGRSRRLPRQGQLGRHHRHVDRARIARAGQPLRRGHRRRDRGARRPAACPPAQRGALPAPRGAHPPRARRRSAAHGLPAHLHARRVDGRSGGARALSRPAVAWPAALVRRGRRGGAAARAGARSRARGADRPAGPARSTSSCRSTSRPARWRPRGSCG